jgi:pimeloyl-ACP methyl ester carboxylesterase
MCARGETARHVADAARRPGPVDVVARAALPPFLLVHGAANSAGVWTFWRAALSERAVESEALDLRGHGEGATVDLALTRMADYAADVRAAMDRLGTPPVLVGWSMGGLVALMAAVGGGARACVALAPSAPARTRDASAVLRPGVFGPVTYGIADRDPDHQDATMPDLNREERAVALASLGPESLLARDDRQAGIVLGPLPCPVLVVLGARDAQWPRRRYRDAPLKADWLEVDASHWGLVLNRRCLRDLVPARVRASDTNSARPTAAARPLPRRTERASHRTRPSRARCHGAPA